MGLLQAYLYFFWYPKDQIFTKLVVVSLVLLETCQTVFYFQASYVLFIDRFGNFTPFSIIPWEAKAQLLSLAVSTFVAQAYFAYTLYLVHKRKILYPLFVACLAVASFGTGIAQTSILFGLKMFLEIDKTKAALNVQAGTAFACDLFITVGLCWGLNTSRTGIQSTNKLINFLIMTAINRGLFTMLFAMLNIILFLVKPEAFYFILMNSLAGKFYMNSLLAILNTREHAHSLTQIGTMANSSVAMSTMNDARSRAAPIGVNVSVARDTDRSYSERHYNGGEDTKYIDMHQ